MSETIEEIILALVQDKDGSSSFNALLKSLEKGKRVETWEALEKAYIRMRTIYGDGLTEPNGEEWTTVPQKFAIKGYRKNVLGGWGDKGDPMRDQFNAREANRRALAFVIDNHEDFFL